MEVMIIRSVIGGLGNKRMCGEHPNYSIIGIGQNTEKSPGDLRKLAVTQTPVRNHRLMLVWKTLKREQIIIIIIPFLKWTRDELRQMDPRTRKLMTMHKALHPRDDDDRLYVPRKEGGRGLASIENSVDASIQRLEDYIKKTWTRTDYGHQKQYWQHYR